jgi:hypothetical protein
MTAPQQAHDGSAAAQQQQTAQPQPQTGAAGPPQHAVQQQQVAVPHQQPGTPTGVTVVSSGVGPQCVQVPTSSIQMQQQQVGLLVIAARYLRYLLEYQILPRKLSDSAL